jgi:hypothetical protein
METDFKVYARKIDIYLKNKRGFWQDECSTNARKTCKEAQEKFCIRHGLDKTQVKANFA